MAGYGTLATALNALETAIADRPYITGDVFSAADVYVGSQIAWGLQFGTIGKRDSFEGYAARVTDRDAEHANEAPDGETAEDSRAPARARGSPPSPACRATRASTSSRRSWP